MAVEVLAADIAESVVRIFRCIDNYPSVVFNLAILLAVCIEGIALLVDDGVDVLPLIAIDGLVVFAYVAKILVAAVDRDSVVGFIKRE